MSNTFETYNSYAAIPNWSERERVATLSAVMVQIEAAPRKMAAFASLGAAHGIPAKTLERLYYGWRNHGDIALADGRRMTRGKAESIFYSDFKTYCERDRNTSRGGYDSMLRDFRAGKEFSFGTWRDVWKRDFPAEAVPAFCPSNWTPRGFTYQNMMRLMQRDPSVQMSLAWNRGGEFAALGATLPVVRSRVGLPVGAVYQADDVWHNVDVYAPGVKGIFQPLEFAIYDVASAYKAVSAMKPRMLTVDPKTGKEVRDNLKEKQFRFAMGYLVCEVGFHKGGVTFILERGTTAIRENVQRRVAAIPGFGRLFHFQTSGVKNAPANAGMMIGNAGGNPRMKSLCECAHNILHNATASLLGNRGRDAAHMHESQAAVVKYSADMIEQARRLDPALVPLLQLPILDYKVYQRYFYAIEDEVMDRHEHRLEGWADREIVEYRLSVASDTWLPVSKLLDMSPEAVTATKAVIAADPANLMRKRKMSRREAWASGQRDLVKLPLFEMPAFLDPRDVAEGQVRADGTIQFTDATYYPGEKKSYIAEVVDRNGMRRRLAPGEKVRFYWNPLGRLADHIWIADAEGGVVGMCPLMRTARWSDPESIKIAMGQKAHQIAELMSDSRARHGESAVARLAGEAVNRALLDNYAEAAAKPVTMGGEAASLEQLAGADDAPETGADDLAPADAASDFLARVSRL